MWLIPVKTAERSPCSSLSCKEEQSVKFVHLSDLHLGKRVNGFSMMEDQNYILKEILNIIDEERPDGVIVAGDVYDKAVPAAEAVCLFDDFLYELSNRQLSVFVISGNHDSPERIAFGSRLLDKSGIYLSPVYDGTAAPVVLWDAFGSVNVYLLPFLKPSHVRRYFEDESIESYTDALRTAIHAMKLDPKSRNILVTHQFVTGASRCESEEISVGGLDNVDASVFEPFDYVALGHIHGPQCIGRETVRYCGTPLKYSFSEAGQEKSVTVAELGKKGEVSVRTVPLVPKRELFKLRGTYLDLTARSYYSDLDREAYYQITLTDEEDIPEAVGRLRVIYPNLMKLDYDNRRTRTAGQPFSSEAPEEKTPMEILEELYEKQNGGPMSSRQRVLAGELIEKIWEDEP